jgi:hypothetical protein
MTEDQQWHQHLDAKLGDTRKKSESRHRASLLVQIATLRLLIKKELVTLEDAIEAIKAVQAEFPDFFHQDALGEEGAWAATLLGGGIPPHGSIANRLIVASTTKNKI